MWNSDDHLLRIYELRPWLSPGQSLPFGPRRVWGASHHCGRRLIIDNCADYDGGGGSGGGNENGGGDTATVVGTYNNQLKAERMKRLCTPRWVALCFWEVVRQHPAKMRGEHMRMRTYTHGNPASQQNHKKIRKKQRWPSEKKEKNNRTVPMQHTCVHVHTLKEITALQTGG